VFCTVARVLLVQPRFPIPSKSLNHKNYLPVGLLKLAAWHQSLGDTVALSLGDLRTDFIPDEVLVTSLFTYWAGHVRAAVQQCRLAFPGARITVGGIYASLQPNHCRDYTSCDEVSVGVHEQAENCLPDYSLVDTDFQIVHASRGCVRKCRFCGTHVVEPVFLPKDSIAAEVVKRHIVFYDNNFLANPHIADILQEIAELRVDGRRVTCESQSGFDGRILKDEPRLAGLLKAARFRYPRIAWDSGANDGPKVESVIQALSEAGFSRKDIQVFMLYNHELGPDELRAKVEQCFQWGVQVSDCRYRPLDLFFDGYKPYLKHQSESEYHVHRGWTDADVRGLRRTVRANNICLRYTIPRDRYAQGLEGFSRAHKEIVADRLGIESKRYTPTELDAMNLEWARTRDADSARRAPGSLLASTS
jgi:hypothetical protein